MSPEERWNRLAVTLTEASILGVKVDAKDYPGGRSRSITIRTADGGVIEIIDTWWRKNDQVWTGWHVIRSNRESIVTSRFPQVKNRAAVREQVQHALAEAGGQRVETVTRALGPQQQRTARTGAQHIHYWAADLEKAIEQNDLDAAAKLLTAITDQAAATAKLVKGARKVGA